MSIICSSVCLLTTFLKTSTLDFQFLRKRLNIFNPQNLMSRIIEEDSYSEVMRPKLGFSRVFGQVLPPSFSGLILDKSSCTFNCKPYVTEKNIF